MALNGWHAGERIMHTKLNYTGAVAGSYQVVQDYMTNQLQIFFRHNLPFLPVAALDDDGRVWSTFAFNRSGKVGFMNTDDPGVMDLSIDVIPDDPLFSILEKNRLGLPERDGPPLMAGIGLDLTNRRRNKMAGNFRHVQRTGTGSFKIRVDVSETCGNCPKYITIRQLVPYPSYEPKLLSKKLVMDKNDRLPDNAIDLIQSVDAIYLGSYYKAPPEDAGRFPSHVGMNHRGGRPGFIRVRKDGRTVVVPDYSGNRFMMSLGNVQANAVASIALANYQTGTVMYLTGKAKNLFGEEAKAIQPRSDLLTLIEVTGYVVIADALSFRQKPGSVAEASPYSPPLRYLADEDKNTEKSIDASDLVLRSIKMLSRDLATFTFDVSHPIGIQPGQYAVIDCTTFIGRNRYQHMASQGMESTLNDDGIRTWTVSSAHAKPTKQLMITMREKPGGAVTSKLFAVARKLQERRPDLLDDSTPLELVMQLIGIGGEFTAGMSAHRFLMLAGGIGITPFVSMLSAFAQQPTVPREVIFVVSTREPDVMLELIKASIGSGSRTIEHINLRLILCTKTKVTTKGIDYEVMTGRVDAALFKSLGDLSEHDIMCCGSLGFEKAVFDGLGRVGIPADRIHKEGFAF